MNGSPRVRTGLDVLVAERFRRLRGLRVGVIANPTSVDCKMRHLADLVHNSPDLELAALFGPEHGVRADAQDMIGVESDRDTRTGAVVHSLYGSGPSSLTPTPEQLEGIDVLVFDIQDVGSRYYTFAATMLYAFKAAAAEGLRFLVLDRPNPLGGEVIEGPMLQPGFESFVGAYPLPIRHGLTVGELARLECAELGINIELEVIACEGWRRGMLWADTGLPWVLPSPNMPTPDTALVYPGGCLIEGTNLSEGRGTTRPFELWGAPWLDPYALVEQVGEAPGALLRPCAFRPTFHKHAGQLCLGVQLHVVDPAAFRSVSLYTRFLAAARAQAPDQFRWRHEPYEFVRDPIAIDLLYGSDRERLAIEAWSEEEFQAITHAWESEEAAFRARCAPHLLYKV
jgi:uncharacterized protein YbbC (DUF1343 family)